MYNTLEEFFGIGFIHVRSGIVLDILLCYLLRNPFSARTEIFFSAPTHPVLSMVFIS